MLEGEEVKTTPPGTYVTTPGIYEHYKGGMYRVTGTAIVSTNGPDDGKLVVKYISLTTGREHVRDEHQFHERGVSQLNPAIPRFKLVTEFING